MADQNNNAFAASLNSPTKPEEKPCGQFLLETIGLFFLVWYSNNSDHSCYAILILEETKKTRAPNEWKALEWPTDNADFE